MAPVPSQTPPGLRDFQASSPRIFWTISAVFASALFLLLIYGLNKLFVFSRRRFGHRGSSLPLRFEKSVPRDLLLPRLLYERHPKTHQAWSFKLRQPSGRSHAGPVTSFEDIHAALGDTKLRQHSWTGTFKYIFWTPFFSSHKSVQPSQPALPTSTTLSPASKAWAAEHDHHWAQKGELTQNGGLVCRGEPIPWILYVPQKSTITPATEPVAITFPKPCVVKGRNTPPLYTSSPRVACAPILSIIEEDEDSTTLDPSDSTLSQDTIWSQESAEFSVTSVPPYILKDIAKKSSEDSVPSIVIEECAEAPLTTSQSIESKLPSLHCFEFGMDFLQVPVPGAERSRPILGSVNRSNFTGGKFKLTAPPRKGRAMLSRFNKAIHSKENAPPPNYF